MILLQFHSPCTFSGICSSNRLFSIAASACAGCQSPSGFGYSAGCLWKSAEEGHDLNLEKIKIMPESAHVYVLVQKSRLN